MYIYIKIPLNFNWKVEMEWCGTQMKKYFEIKVKIFRYFHLFF